MAVNRPHANERRGVGMPPVRRQGHRHGFQDPQPTGQRLGKSALRITAGVGHLGNMGYWSEGLLSVGVELLDRFQEVPHGTTSWQQRYNRRPQIENINGMVRRQGRLQRLMVQPYDGRRGESNSRPSGGHRACYDHSRVCGLRLPLRRVVRIRGSGRRIFLRCQRSLPAVSGSLPAVHHCFWCQAAAVWPRVPLLVAMILEARSVQIRRRERERRYRRLFGCPV